MKKSTINRIKSLVKNNYALTVSVWVDVFEDNFNEGEVQQVNYFDYDTETYLTDLSNLSELLKKYIKDNCILLDEIKKENFEVLDGQIVTGQQVNAGNFKPTNEELEQFEKDEINLYTQNINFIFRINGQGLPNEILKEIIGGL